MRPQTDGLKAIMVVEFIRFKFPAPYGREGRLAQVIHLLWRNESWVARYRSIRVDKYCDGSRSVKRSRFYSATTIDDCRFFEIAGRWKRGNSLRSIKVL